MTNQPIENELDALFAQIKLIEVRLDKATDAFQEFCRANPNVSYLKDADLLSFKQEEELFGLEWTESYESLLKYKPQSFQEFKHKTLELIDFIDRGFEDPKIIDVIRGDLESLELGEQYEAITKDIAVSDLKQTFLIIDDSSVDRMLIKRALSKVQSDLEFVELDNGSNVVEMIKTKKPTLTLLDVRMPGIDGFDVLKLIREEADLREHPVLMLSSSSEDKDIEIAMETGANGYFAKPTSLDEYSTLAARILEEAVA